MKQQTGVALLTILLLVVAITVVAGSMLASQKVMVREYGVAQTQTQFNQYSLYAEAVAKQLIYEDSQANQTDSLQDIWAKPINKQSLHNAEISIKIHDHSERFNINNLYHDGRVNHHAVAYFTALLTANGLEANIAQAVLDWQDPDSDTTGEGGAEFEYYQSLGKNKPIYIANQPFSSVDELIDVRGMDKEKLAKIKPLLTAVPFFLPMNVNMLKPALLSPISMIHTTKQDENSQNQNPTASTPASTATPQPNQTIQNTSGQIDLLEINNWASKRDTAVPLENVEMFWQLPMMNGVSSEQKTTMNHLLSVQSHAFGLLITVKADDKQRFFASSLAKVEKGGGNSLSNIGVNQDANSKIVVFNRRILPFLPKD